MRSAVRNLDDFRSGLVVFLYDAGEVVPIDGDAWDVASGWPMSSGVAMQLHIGSFDAASNDSPTSWCPATQPFELGDLGTPVTPNDGC